jgi:hypothetical protein
MTSSLCGSGNFFNTLPFAHKAEQKMFCPNRIVLEALNFLLSQMEYPPGSFRIPILSVSMAHPFLALFLPSAARSEPSWPFVASAARRRLYLAGSNSSCPLRDGSGRGDDGAVLPHDHKLRTRPSHTEKFF